MRNQLSMAILGGNLENASDQGQVAHRKVFESSVPKRACAECHNPAGRDCQYRSCGLKSRAPVGPGDARNGIDRVEKLLPHVDRQTLALQHRVELVIMPLDRRCRRLSPLACRSVNQSCKAEPARNRIRRFLPCAPTPVREGSSRNASCTELGLCEAGFVEAMSFLVARDVVEIASGGGGAKPKIVPAVEDMLMPELINQLTRGECPRFADQERQKPPVFLDGERRVGFQELPGFRDPGERHRFLLEGNADPRQQGRRNPLRREFSPVLCGFFQVQPVPSRAA